MGFEVFKFIDQKKLGMILLCNLIAKDFESQAKNNAYWKDQTSNARQGINSRAMGANGNYIISLSHGVDYGEILEEGSKPHIITPKNGKALYWKGAVHPVKKVNHPGTKGFKTFETVLENNKVSTVERIIEYWSE